MLRQRQRRQRPPLVAVVVVAATGGGGGGGSNDSNNNNDKRRGGAGGGLLARWAAFSSREKFVVVAFFALAALFGPRLLLLSLVSLEAAGVNFLLAAERALGSAFLTSFTFLAGVAALILAGLFVYFLVLEEERLEEGEGEEEEK